MSSVQQGLTFALAGDLVPQHVDLVDGAKRLEHGPDVVLVHLARHLTHEHLDGVRVRLVPAPTVRNPPIRRGRRRRRTAHSATEEAQMGQKIRVYGV